MWLHGDGDEKKITLTIYEKYIIVVVFSSR